MIYTLSPEQFKCEQDKAINKLNAYPKKIKCLSVNGYYGINHMA